MRPLVSVIVPFLDQEPFLEEAIGSVRAQTLEDWELLLVDDGSSDASPAIAAAHAAADPGRIKVLRHADGGNHGAAAARNLGLAHATGEFVGFLDADDLYEADKLLTESALLKGMPEAMMLYGPTRWFYPAGGRRDWVERLGVAADRLYQPPHLATRILLRQKGHIPCTCGVLVRRSAAIAVGGFEERFRLYEDQTLWAKLFLGYPAYVSSRCMARYRQHGASTSAAARRAGDYHSWRLHAAQHAFMEWMEAYAAESGIADRRLAAALAARLAPYRHPSYRHLLRRRLGAAARRVVHSIVRR